MTATCTSRRSPKGSLYRLNLDGATTLIGAEGSLNPVNISAHSRLRQPDRSCTAWAAARIPKAKRKPPTCTGSTWRPAPPARSAHWATRPAPTCKAGCLSMTLVNSGPSRRARNSTMAQPDHENRPRHRRRLGGEQTLVERVSRAWPLRHRAAATPTSNPRPRRPPPPPPQQIDDVRSVPTMDRVGLAIAVNPAAADRPAGGRRVLTPPDAAALPCHPDCGKLRL